MANWPIDGGMMADRVLVTGATGFIGGRLAPALVDAGWHVRAMSRHPESYVGPGDAVYGDVSDPDSLPHALDGVRFAYYLVHSLGSGDFERRDAAAATAFGAACAAAGVQQIVYLGGLGNDKKELSAHLRSRREVERLLALGGVAVTTLRAAVIIGKGGISWEITRQLGSRLPAMVAPHWVRTRTQPIAVSDVIGYLVGVLGRSETYRHAYDIGGPEIMRYDEMLTRAERTIHGRTVPILVVPLLTPRLSSLWLTLITDVDVPTARTLVDSMTNEMIVRDPAIRSLLPRNLVGYDDAVRAAVTDQPTAAKSHSSN
jgi:uncharacterized protein YbjT (DUF2867 family)